MTNSPRFPLRAAARCGAMLLGVGVLALGTAGCNALATVVAKVGENPTIPPKYVMKKVPTVILVENFRNPDLAADDSELLARCLQDKIEKKKVFPIVKAEKIQDLRNVKPKEFGQMTTPEIAKAVGAEQVIYIDLQGGGIGSMTGQSLFQGRATAAVRVIDAKTGLTLFPPDSADGIYINFETDPVRGKDEGSYASVRSELYDGLATQIGRLFYPWKQDASEEMDP